MEHFECKNCGTIHYYKVSKMGSHDEEKLACEKCGTIIFSDRKCAKVFYLDYYVLTDGTKMNSKHQKI